MREARGLEYETCGEGEPVLLIHGSHVAEQLRDPRRVAETIASFLARHPL